MRRAFALAVLAVALCAVPADAAPPEGPPITTVTGKPSRELGEQLFAANCARCHGISGRGRAHPAAPGLIGPPLRGVGALAADFYLRTGYMPLQDARDQPVRSRQRFNEAAIRSLVQYVDSLGAGPAIPHPDVAAGDVEKGRELFTEHCSGCHQVVAEGGVLTGAKAPPLDRANVTQIAEAVRIGPYVMPKFSKSDLSDSDVNSIAAYVRYAANPDDRGGWGINHLGPFPEGMITWLVAIPLLLILCRVIGKKARA